MKTAKIKTFHQGYLRYELNDVGSRNFVRRLEMESYIEFETPVYATIRCHIKKRLREAGFHVTNALQEEITVLAIRDDVEPEEMNEIRDNVCEQIVELIEGENPSIAHLKQIGVI